MSFFDKRTNGRIKKPLFVILYSGPGLGKCFEPSTEVLMFNGSIKKIKDIVIGDKVMGPDSKPRTVNGLSHGISDMYKVDLKKGDSFICNDRHDIYGQTKKFKDYKVEARELAKLTDHEIVNYKILRTGVKFKKQDTKLDPYFVGVWLGDGNKCLKTLHITNPDKEIWKYLSSFCKKNDLIFNNVDNLALRLIAYKRGDKPRRHPLKHKLEECVVNEEKRIPSSYLINNRKNRLKMLAGLLDTDGYLAHKVFEIVTQYEGLAKDIVFLAKSLGFQATHGYKVVDGKSYGRIVISGETSEIPTKIKRKQAGKRLQIKSVLREGFSINKLPKKGEYIGIRVDGDHLFMLANFVIVHNTTFASSFPSPHFFDFEESTHCIDVSRTRPLTFTELMDDLEEIRDADDTKGIKTLAFDTIDEMERLIHFHVAAAKDKDHIEDIGWQKGYDLSVNHWATFISLCREIRDKHKMHFIFLAHSTGRTHTDLDNGESYSRHAMGLHRKAASYLFGQVEMVLFAKKDVVIRITDGKTIAKDTDKRILLTELSAHHDAKNRIGLPTSLPMPYKNAYQVLWGAYEKAFNDTPESVYKECVKAIAMIESEERREPITNYINNTRDDISKLRAALVRIKKILKGDK